VSFCQALHILAEIYRRGRRLWPLIPLGGADGPNTVTIRVDQIKDLSVEDIRAVYGSGDSWLLFKRNEKEAVVRVYCPICVRGYCPIF